MLHHCDDLRDRHKELKTRVNELENVLQRFIPSTPSASASAGGPPISPSSAYGGYHIATGHHIPGEPPSYQRGEVMYTQIPSSSAQIVSPTTTQPYHHPPGVTRGPSLSPQHQRSSSYSRAIAARSPIAARHSPHLSTGSIGTVVGARGPTPLPSPTTHSRSSIATITSPYYQSKNFHAQTSKATTLRINDNSNNSCIHHSSQLTLGGRLRMCESIVVAEASPSRREVLVAPRLSQVQEVVVVVVVVDIQRQRPYRAVLRNQPLRIHRTSMRIHSSSLLRLRGPGNGRDRRTKGRGRSSRC